MRTLRRSQIALAAAVATIANSSPTISGRANVQKPADNLANPQHPLYIKPIVTKEMLAKGRDDLNPVRIKGNDERFSPQENDDALYLSGDKRPIHSTEVTTETMGKLPFAAARGGGTGTGAAALA